MIVQGAAVMNLIIAVIGCAVCILSLFFIAFGIKRNTRTAVIMLFLFIFLLVRNLCVAFLQLTQGHHGAFWEEGIYIAGFGTYLFSILSSYLISFFVLDNVIISEEGIRRIRIILNAFLAVCMIVLVWAQISGLLVNIDDSGMYYMGEFYYYSNLMSVAYLAFDILMLAVHGKEMPIKSFHRCWQHLQSPFINNYTWRRYYQAYP